jgi:SAM-dependent methyltransferase
MASYEELEAEALAAPVSGWDFSWLARRSSTEPLPWSYRREVARYAGSAGSAGLGAAVLDMGTGGGEVLSRLLPLLGPGPGSRSGSGSRPVRVVATEAWAPNVPVAAARLRPLGIPVVQNESAPNNTSPDGPGGRLPFRDGAFGLVINRHEAFRAAEVSRVLAPGGAFVTQQVDFSSYEGLYGVLGLAAPAQRDSWLPMARRQVADAGLREVTAIGGEEVEQFNDVAAVIYYLRMISWAIPEYSLPAYRERLRAAWADRSRWPVINRQRRFLLVAERDGGLQNAARPAPPCWRGAGRAGLG